MLEYIVACTILMLIACGFFIAPFIRCFKKSPKEAAYWQQQWKALDNKQQQREILLDKSVISAQESQQLQQELIRDYLLKPMVKEQANNQDETAQSLKECSRIPQFLSGFLVLLFVSALLVDYLSGRSQEAFGWYESSRWMLPKVEAYLAGNDTLFEEAENKDIDTLLFLRSLQLYLQKHSEDVQAWSVLANLLTAAEANNLALTAYQRAYRAAYFKEYQGLIPKDKYALTYVNARLLNSGGELDEESYRILKNILEENPQNESALMLLGMAAYHSRHFALAENAWSRLLANLESKPDVPGNVLESLRKSIATAKTAALAENNNVVQDSSAKGHSRLQFALLVTVDEKFKNLLKEGSILFVFLKMPGSQGMPLAAIRQPVNSTSEFPMRLTIGSEHVLAGQSLEAHEQFELSARISQSGQALAQKGDLESNKTLLEKTGSQQILEITIDKIRE